LNSINYRSEFELVLNKSFIPAGYEITKSLERDEVPESSQYGGMVLSIDDKRIVYRKGKVTPDRPGAFLAIWKRPSSDNGNKPIPLESNDLDFLFIQVERHSSDNDEISRSSNHGMFIFPVSLLIEKGIVSSAKKKGKAGFRVFPPWSQDRGSIGTKVFSDSGKKTQRWQLPYFLEIDEFGSMNSTKLNNIINNKRL
jgi:hypothetical protein